jgi:hypothetical protein
MHFVFIWHHVRQRAHERDIELEPAGMIRQAFNREDVPCVRVGDRSNVEVALDGIRRVIPGLDPRLEVGPSSSELRDANLRREGWVAIEVQVPVARIDDGVLVFVEDVDKSLRMLAGCSNLTGRSG